MGLVLLPVFETPFDAPANDLGEALGAALIPLEEVAAEVGLVPLSAFGDGRAPPDDFDGDPEAFFEALGPSTDWYDAAEGRAAVLTLVAALEAEPGYVEALGDGLGDAVIEELRALAELLAAAAAAKSRFRIDLA